MARFIHTGDWQLGMTRRFLGEEAQARFTDDRFEAVRTIGRIAREERCEFVVVAGDVFETNQVDRRTVARACDAIASIAVPVFLLPGNHDPLNAGSVLRSPTFRAKAPSCVTVLDDPSPREVRPGIEVVGAPWTSKRPLTDLVAAAAWVLEPRAEIQRVLVGHGAVDLLSPDPDNPALISVAAAEAALSAGRVSYVALGDRHSLTQVGATGLIWYAGSPVATDFDEVKPGFVLVVDTDERSTIPKPVGAWRFLALRHELLSQDDSDLDVLERTLRDLPAKDRTVLKLALVGTLTLRRRASLDAILEHGRDVFAALDVQDRHSDLVVVANDADFAGLALTGFASTAVENLRAQATSSGDGAATARDSLALLVRLAGGGA